MISGRSRLTTYEKTEKRKPGKSSSVTAAPPSTGALLEDQGLQPGARQIGRADEAVVAAADDDRVVRWAKERVPPKGYPECISV